jgi:hypothetical protein
VALWKISLRLTLPLIITCSDYLYGSIYWLVAQMEAPEQQQRVAPPEPYVSMCYPPDEAELDRKAALITKRGPSQVPTEVWVCGNIEAHPTGEVVRNEPTDNYLLKLPALTCSGCGRLVGRPTNLAAPALCVTNVLTNKQTR